jgi:hypothetical protein
MVLVKYLRIHKKPQLLAEILLFEFRLTSEYKSICGFRFVCRELWWVEGEVQG